MIPFKRFVFLACVGLSVVGYAEDEVAPSSGSAANPNAAFKAPAFDTNQKTTTKEWKSYNRHFQRDLRLKQETEAPKVTPKLGPAVPPPEAVLPRSENAPGGGHAAFTAPDSYITPGSTAQAPGIPGFGSSSSSAGFPQSSTSGGAFPTGPGGMPKEEFSPPGTNAPTSSPSGDMGTPASPSSSPH